MKTILITGGAGFIGSHLCEKFLKKGFQIICLDNFLTGQKKNIIPFLNHPHFTFIQSDVSQAKTYKNKLIQQAQIDYILHFASPAGPNPGSPKSYLQYPVKTYLVNSIGTHYLLKLAQKKRSEFIFASTSEVYGDPLKHPQKESYWGNVNPIGPRSCYDESKRFGEMVTMTFGKKYQLKTKILRIFNTYGPKMNPEDGRVIPLFITQALQNKDITIYGNGKQTRSFCYIDDLINYIILVMQKGKTYQAYNLGNDQELTIKQLAQKIKNLTKSKSSIVYKVLPPDDPQKRKPDLNKIKKLGSLSKTQLIQGLRNTIKYFQEVK